jgi:hypothetical protein
MTVPAVFADAVVYRVFDLGKGGLVVRTEHPALPGQPIIGLLEPGLPESALQEKKAACMVALHDEFTKQITAEWDIL